MPAMAAPADIESTVTLRFYGPLDRIRSRRTSDPEYALTLPYRRSVKDLIESEGVPHTEVAMVLINGEPAGLDYVLSGGERISAFPAFARLKGATHELRPPPLVADVHLGKLARRLRLLGFDCVYGNSLQDEEIAERSASECRTVLTCDRQLLMRRQVTAGLLILSNRADEQVDQVLERLSPLSDLQPYTRCLDCNGLLGEVPAEQVHDLLPPLTRIHVTTCFRCTKCGKPYWKGGHWTAIENWVQRAMERTAAFRMWEEEGLPADSRAGPETTT